MDFMNLTFATLFTGLLLLVLGVALVRYSTDTARRLGNFPRSKPATLVLLVAATLWVLWNVSQLGEADFGNYKVWLGAFFLILGVGAWFYVPDFLGVRSLAVLLMLSSGTILNAAFLQEPVTRLFLAGFCYFVILLSLYLAAVPYRLRDWVQYVEKNNRARTLLGSFTTAYGILLLLLPLSY